MPVGNVMRDVVSETMRNDVRCVRERVSAWVIGKNTKLDPPPPPRKCENSTETTSANASSFVIYI
jgi:hypothetical protein